MDNKLLERTRAKLKHDLSCEEQEALRKCSATVNTHSRIGAVLGGSLSVYGMYRRKLWPLSKYWGRGLFFGVGGIVVGMQLGLVTASIRCVQIVKALPNPEHVMKALREVQIELQDARRRPLQGEREWTQKGDEVSDTADTAGAQPFKTQDNQPYWSNTEQITSVYNGPGPAPEPAAGSISNKEASQNVWQQLRGEASKRPETAWDRIRNGSKEDKTKPKDDSPFAIPPAETYTTDSRTQDFDTKTDQRTKEQREFDAMLEKERVGSMEGGFSR